jgi:hypothetical protein
MYLMGILTAQVSIGTLRSKKLETDEIEQLLEQLDVVPNIL